MHSRNLSPPLPSPPPSPTGSGNHRYFMGYLFFLLCMICWMMYGCISCELDPPTPTTPPPLGFPLSSLTSSSSSLRLEDPLRHQLRQGRLLALPDPDRLLLPLDVLDVPQQRLPLHVGGGAHHVSALPGPTRLNSHCSAPALHPRRLIVPTFGLFWFFFPTFQIAALGITTNERMNARRYKHFKVTATSIESPFK